MMKAILITGVGGLIGSRMAEWLVENQPDYTIIGVDNLSATLRPNTEVVAPESNSACVPPMRLKPDSDSS